jgi:zinc/manganese transport system substrate-binding protein
MMKHSKLSFFLVSLVLLWSATAAAQLKVVTTVPDLAALASEIGGDRVSVQALSRHSQDPHYVDARPSLVVALNRADLLIVNGMELEVGWLPPLQVQSRNPKIQLGAQGYLDASTVIQPMEVPLTVDRSQGDVHPQGNPHFLFDPRRALKISQAISARLGQLDPAGAATYKANQEKLAQQLDAFAKEQTQRFAALPAEKRQVVTFHRSLVYLLDWLQLKRQINVQPRPGIQPTPSHTAKVLQTMRASGVRAILQEEFYPRKTSQTLARLGKARLVVIEGATRFDEGEGYLDHMRKVTEAIYVSLQ